MNWLDANVLPWLIPIPPFVAFFLIILAAGRSKLLSHIIAIGAVALSWLMSVATGERDPVQRPGYGVTRRVRQQPDMAGKWHERRRVRAR